MRPARSTRPLVEKVWTACKAKGLYGRTLTLKVKYADFDQITRSRSRATPLVDQEDLAALADELIASAFPPPKPVRLLGITASSFKPLAAAVQLKLPIG